jgi:biotin carboxylase
VRLLLLATNFGSQYRALRCLAALGADIHVLGSGGARSLALSRYCERFVPFDFDCTDSADAAGRLDRAAEDAGAGMVVPGDLPTAHFLARIKPHLKTLAFPLSDPAAIEALGTKDRFMEFCHRLGIAHPEGIVFSTAESVRDAFESGRIALPAMLKPLGLSGGLGVVRVDENNAAREIARISYEPILVQSFVEGTDRCISLFCRDGRVLKQAVYENARGEFGFLEDSELERIAADIVSALNLTGVIGFDARIDRTGKVWMIECNPRFTFNMDVAMVAGLNFADWSEPAFGVRQLTAQKIRIPDALVRALLQFRGPSAADLRMLIHWLKDPLVFALVALGYQQRWRLPLFEKIMTGAKCAA